ncbi:MAG: pyrrolo-quinoline quinone, partial [Planctomyces sp.]|nr:pyrrolo-quinoline quinone [Planctomyces sp.]
MNAAVLAGRSRLTMRLFSSALVALAAFTGGEMPEASAQQTSGLITQDQAQALGLERAWWGQAVFNPSRDKISHVVIDEDNVYVQASSGHITAFDAEDGRKLWAVLLGTNDEPMFPMAANETDCLAIVGAKMVCMEKRTGKILWTLRLPGAPSTGAALDENHVYFGALDGSVYAFSLKRIRELYLEQRLPQWSNDAFVWRYKAAGEITSPPIPSGRLVKFASRDGSV